jgi:hypothetical protein
MVMSRQTGEHPVLEYDANDAIAVAEAMKEFNRLVAEGQTPAINFSEGKSEIRRQFDPNAGFQFYPRLQGG